MSVKRDHIPAVRSGVSAGRRHLTELLPRAGSGRRRTAFTLIEMLVVIAVIGIVAAISVPALKNMQKADAEDAATRQLVDEVANARQRAISQRSDVYLVFIPPADATYFNGLASFQELLMATNLLRSQFVGYGFYSERSVGDQPGQSFPRYHGDWRTLTEGVFVATNKFYTAAYGVLPFAKRLFPFPTATSPARMMPYIGFDYQGRVFHYDLLTGERIYGPDEIIPLARGTVSGPSGGGNYTATVQEIPAGNSITNYNHVRVDWLTGRASVQRQQVQ